MAHTPADHILHHTLLEAHIPSADPADSILLVVVDILPVVDQTVLADMALAGIAAADFGEGSFGRIDWEQARSNRLVGGGLLVVLVGSLMRRCRRPEVRRRGRRTFGTWRCLWSCSRLYYDFLLLRCGGCIIKVVKAKAKKNRSVWEVEEISPLMSLLTRLY